MNLIYPRMSGWPSKRHRAPVLHTRDPDNVEIGRSNFMLIVQDIKCKTCKKKKKEARKKRNEHGPHK